MKLDSLFRLELAQRKQHSCHFKLRDQEHLFIQSQFENKNIGFCTVRELPL